MNPDIKADQIVSEQLEVYKENTEEIKRLKEKKAELPIAKWKVYFGN